MENIQLRVGVIGLGIGKSHAKGVQATEGAQLYALIKEDGSDDIEVKKEAEPAFDFRPVGYGVQNFPDILAAVRDAGSEWIVVEQDEPAMGKSRLESVEMSINYLRTIL